MKKSALSLTVFLVIGILVLINLLSEDLYFRLDFTEGGQYTLSKVTRDVLQNLEEPITAKVYFSEGLPPQYDAIQREFKDLLTEYANVSKDNIQFEYVNPSESKELSDEAEQLGMQPFVAEIREENALKQQKAFMGILLQLGEAREVIPTILVGSFEYELTKSIKKLSIVDKPSIAFLQGHGEPPLQALIQVNQALSALYNMEPLTLNDSTPIPPRYRTIAWVNPSDTIPEQHLAQLDQFLGKGGKLMLALNRVQGNLSGGGQTPPMGLGVNTGVERWLESKGIMVEEKFVIDAASEVIGIQQQQGPFTFVNQIQFPFFPIIQNFADHPISGGLEAVSLQFVSPIQFDDKKISGNIFTPIIFSSNVSDTLSAPQFFDIEKEWTENDFKQGNFMLAGTLEGKLGKGDSLSKMVLVADGDFPINGQGEQARAIREDNINLFVNSIDWLSGDTDLAVLRSRIVTSRPLAEVSLGTQNFLRYFNFLFPIVLVLGYAFFRRQQRRYTRLKREKESYLD